MEYRFYHLTKSTMPRAVGQLAQKVVQQDKTLDIVCSDLKRIDEIDAALWSDFDFLPHSKINPDGVSKIFIGDSPSGNADIVFVLDDAKIQIHNEELACYLFHSLDLDIVEKRRKSWKEWSEQGIFLTYWSENENGQWKKVLKPIKQPKIRWSFHLPLHESREPALKRTSQ